MKIRFASIAWTGVSNVFSKALVALEFLASEAFSEKSYGADIVQFVAVAIAIGEPEENKKFSKHHDKSGSDKHPISGEKIKYISFALQFSPEKVEGKDEVELKVLFCNALLERLGNPEIKIPKGFDYEKFCTDMKFFINGILLV